MEKKQRKQLVIQMLTAGIITFCLLWLLFYIKKYVPFGVHSLASKDADFQYLDFLAYLKDVFDGKNNIDYSFSKSIGGACIEEYSVTIFPARSIYCCCYSTNPSLYCSYM